MLRATGGFGSIPKRPLADAWVMVAGDAILSMDRPTAANQEIGVPIGVLYWIFSVTQFPLVVEMPAHGHSAILDLDVVGEQIERHDPTGVQAWIWSAEQFGAPDHDVAGRVL